MLKLDDYLQLPEPQLADHDIAAYHLACAEGLPGSGKWTPPGASGLWTK
jgi:hypothetical protein